MGIVLRDMQDQEEGSQAWHIPAGVTDQRLVELKCRGRRLASGHVGEETPGGGCDLPSGQHCSEPDGCGRPRCFTNASPSLAGIRGRTKRVPKLEQVEDWGGVYPRGPGLSRRKMAQETQWCWREDHLWLEQTQGDCLGLKVMEARLLLGGGGGSGTYRGKLE